MPNVIMKEDLWGESVIIYDYKDTPECEICKSRERGGNFEGRGKRRAKLRTHTDVAIKNKDKKQVGHLGKIKGDPQMILKNFGKRPPELNSDEVYACECCETAWNMGKKFANTKPNTLPI
jgi:hypothetical protein